MFYHQMCLSRVKNQYAPRLIPYGPTWLCFIEIINKTLVAGKAERTKHNFSF